MSRTAAPLRDGVILNNRYQIVKQIGRGDRGRRYLSEDIHRYRELCVLQEFGNWVQNDRQLQKAVTLFEQQAGILSRIAHPQIPRLDPLLQTVIDGRRSLFIVRQHVEGTSYWQLLQDRGKLTETEVNSMLREVLAILNYIHTSRLVHGNISPHNIILRDSDCRSVLINFSCIKALTNAVSPVTHSTKLVTDPDYCPDEQIRHNRATVCSDLYSLAVTTLVLLTGKPPQELYDSHQQKWNWSDVKVSSDLRKVLNKMLAPKPCDRYQSADRVRHMLSEARSSVFSQLRWHLRPHNGSLRNSCRTDRSPKIACLKSSATQASRQINASTTNWKKVKPWQWGMISAGIIGVIFIPGLISFVVIKNKIAVPVAVEPSVINVADNREQQLQQSVNHKIELLEIDAAAFFKQVDTIFYERYPKLKGVSLTESEEHQSYRQIWYQIASNLLNERQQQ